MTELRGCPWCGKLTYPFPHSCLLKTPCTGCDGFEGEDSATCPCWCHPRSSHGFAAEDHLDEHEDTDD